MPGNQYHSIHAGIINALSKICLIFNGQTKRAGGNYRNPSVYIFYDMLRQLQSFGFIDTEHFTAQAIGKDPFYTCLQVKINKRIYSIKINIGFQIKRRDHYGHKLSGNRMHQFFALKLKKFIYKAM